jgi:transposase
MAMVISYRVEVTGMRVAPAIDLSPEARTELQRLVRRRTTPVRVAERCRIVLLAAEGLQNKQIAARMAVAPRMAALWRDRFLALGVEGLLRDAPRPGRKPSITAETVAAVIAKTTQNAPQAATHWSRSTMAREAGISDSSVGRILARPWTQAPSRRKLQGQQRSGLRRETGSYRRTLPPSSRARAGLVRR